MGDSVNTSLVYIICYEYNCLYQMNWCCTNKPDGIIPLVCRKEHIVECPRYIGAIDEQSTFTF
jgi:hypothetical protein